MYNSTDKIANYLLAIPVHRHTYVLTLHSCKRETHAADLLSAYCHASAVCVSREFNWKGKAYRIRLYNMPECYYSLLLCVAVQ